MNILFGILLFFGIVMLAIGLIKPTALNASRKKTVLVYGTLAVVSFFGIGAVSTKLPEPTIATEAPSQTASTATATDAPSQTTSTSTPATTNPQVASERNAENLATIDGKSAYPSAASVQVFQTILSDLHTKCQEDETGLTDLLVTGQQVIQQHLNQYISLLDLANGLNTAASAKQGGKQSCKDIMVLMVTLMRANQNK